jgi:hypothetical protein
MLPSLEIVPGKLIEIVPPSEGLVPVNVIELPEIVPLRDVPVDVDVKVK